MAQGPSRALRHRRLSPREKMILVRILSCDSEAILALHLKRLGLAPDAISAQVRRSQGLQVLVTGLSGQVADGLPTGAGLPKVLRGAARDADAVLLSGSGDELQALSTALNGRGGELAEVGRALSSGLSAWGGTPEPIDIGRRRFEWGRRTYLMGILNVTPDSFSAGGRYHHPAAAVAAGERRAGEGADLIDIGGESTRPGSEPVSVEKELNRVLPVIERLSKLVDVPLSVDTTKAAVAEAAVRAGASLVNDISGLRFDPEMAPTVARLGGPVCLMHIQGVPRTMQREVGYQDLMAEVLEYLEGSLELARQAGIAPQKLLVDPGIGFGKTAGHNLFLLRNLRQLRALGCPLLVGASRKSFIGKVTGSEIGHRLPGSLAMLAAAIQAGADVVRVHDVSESVAAARMMDAVAHAKDGGEGFGQPSGG